MNLNFTVKCDSCGAPTNCRVGMSNREVQPLAFACQSCGQVIDILYDQNGRTIDGAHEVDGSTPFKSDENFVDLHLDFPVSFGPYVMGATPFMQAMMRIGSHAIGIHSARLTGLDASAAKRKKFQTVLKHYERGKITPMKAVSERVFDVQLKSENPGETLAAIFSIIGKMVWPFDSYEVEQDPAHMFAETLKPLYQNGDQSFSKLVRELVSSGFLVRVQKECHSIYPRIIESELVLRPALFLDFDETYQNAPIPNRVSTSEFQYYRDLYKDICEVVSRQLVLVAGINNLLKRGDHNLFLAGIGLARNGHDYTPSSLDEFAKVDFGRKAEYIDDSWYDLDKITVDNQLRNAVAHHKTQYDEINQQIAYYPRKEGVSASSPHQTTFLDFVRQLLTSYRDLHIFSHLIHLILYYYYSDFREAPVSES